MLRYVIFLFIYLSSCNHYEQKSKITGFSITGPSYLFFKNLRSPYYTIVENEQKHIRTYTLKKRQTAKDQIVILPHINIHWLEDRASVSIQINNQINTFKPIVISVSSSQSEDNENIIIYPQHPDHTLVAIKIYDHLKNGGDMHIIINSQKIKLFSTKANIARYRITILDFLRLVEAL